ncbi:hypothetical protein J7E73_16485 [Paenibacillus albidus]|uniref:hypothetical protein n=1 Tax=Paenibacillus albidus TaxID=2041023 RepID=UPI001BE5AB56|nr:hypothetical protein [Paenibacillus albidus]MBT2290698.1 hypothetical protein [Paenibacillus albidus]
MNYSLKLRKIALSTLLLSAVASPVFANADNGTQADGSKNTETFDTATAVKPVDSIFITTVFPDLLDLVATYAPDTAQDWKEVLGKMVTNNPQAETIIVGQAVAATPVVNPDNLNPAPAGEVRKGATATRIAAAVPLDNAFITAQTELSKAIESKEAAAIKESLNELLKQYKILVGQLEGVEPTSKS